MVFDRIGKAPSGSSVEPGTFGTVRRLLATELRRHRIGYAAAFAMMLLASAATALLAYLMRDVVNRIFVEQSYAAVWWLSGAVMVLYTVKGLSSYGQAVLLARIGNRIVADDQKQIFDRLLDQGVEFFSAVHTAEILMRFNAGASAARDALNLLVTSIGRDLVLLVGLFAVALVQDRWLAVVSVIALPAAALGVRNLVRRVRDIFRREFHSGVAINRLAQEAFQGIRTVKSFNLEDEHRARMNGHIDSFERANNKMAAVQSRSGPLMEWLGGLAIAAVILYAGHSVLAGGKTPGEFFSALTAFILAYEPAKRLAQVNVQLSASLAAVRMLFALLDLPPAEQESANRPRLMVRRGRIEFEDVVFGYRSGEPVLKKLSFIAEPGQTTALVGPSGSGKTTIMNLLEGFYEPQAGAISIDGQPIREVSRKSLRDAIALVSQDVFLFSGSIRENIAFGRPGAGEDKIVAAAEAANAHGFITRFERGYDTIVGEHGAQLSGGQRQRIAIARAFLKNAPILLLDEATAALDSESEAEVYAALEALKEHRTTLVIAHRLATVVAADRICVIDDGRAVETGRHDELMARRGRYHGLYRTQFANTQPAPADSPPARSAEPAAARAPLAHDALSPI